MARHQLNAIELQENIFHLLRQRQTHLLAMSQKLSCFYLLFFLVICQQGYCQARLVAALIQRKC